MRGKSGLFSRYVSPATITFDGSDGAQINVGGSSRSGTVLYAGSGHTTSRVFRMNGTTGGATFDASGTGALVLTSNFTAAHGVKTLTLTGTNTNDNAVASIPNAAGAAVSFVKAGSGRWKLTAASNYTGTSKVLSGTVVVAVNTTANTGAFGATATLPIIGDDAASISGTAALLLASGVTFAKSLQVPALGSGANQFVVLGGANTSGTSEFSDSTQWIYCGRNVILQAASGGTVEFRNKWTNVDGTADPDIDVTVGTSGNTGTVKLLNNLKTTGTVTVEYGTLHVSGAAGRMANASEVVLDGSGATLRHTATNAIDVPITIGAGTLSGSGEIATAVTAGTNATLSPGDPVGSQAYSSGLTLASGGTYRWEINDWDGAAGTAYDQLAVSGSALDVTATSGSTFTLKIVGLTAGNVPGAVPDFDNTTSRSFTIATSGSLTGFAANKFTINDAEFTNNNDLDGGTWSLSDSGNDIVLTFTP